MFNIFYKQNVLDFLFIYNFKASDGTDGFI